jgi:hypothetical protein
MHYYLVSTVDHYLSSKRALIVGKKIEKIPQKYIKKKKKKKKLIPAISMAANHFADKTRHKKHVYGFIFTLDTNNRIFDGIILF